MGSLEGRVCAITGAGRGIGREHARLFASEGAKVVVNDLGGAGDGTGSDVTAAQAVVDEIAANRGEAVAHTDDISTWAGGQSLTQTAFGRYGVRVNGIAPAARTRLTVDVPMIGEMMKAPEDPDAFDPFHPRHVSPLVAWPASEDCHVTGGLFAVQGGAIQKLSGWSVGDGITTEGDWTIDNIAAQLGAARV